MRVFSLSIVFVPTCCEITTHLLPWRLLVINKLIDNSGIYVLEKTNHQSQYYKGKDRNLCNRVDFSQVFATCWFMLLLLQDPSLTLCHHYNWFVHKIQQVWKFFARLCSGVFWNRRDRHAIIIQITWGFFSLCSFVFCCLWKTLQGLEHVLLAFFV